MSVSQKYGGFTLALLAACFLAGDVRAQSTEQQRLLATDGSAHDHFGIRVSISDDVAVVGGYLHDQPRLSGRVYVFRLHGSQWDEEQILGPTTGLWFGGHVAVSGDVMAGGSFGLDAAGVAPGQVDVYREEGGSWHWRQTLTADDGGVGDRFGVVAAAGDVIVVGAYLDDTCQKEDTGSTYVFRFSAAENAWVQEAHLTACDLDAFAYFGLSVAVEGDFAVIGAPGNNGGFGSTYIFRYDHASATWIQCQQITGSSVLANDHFGVDVSLSANTIVVGADGIDHTIPGRAYIFERLDASCSWQETAVLSPPATRSGDQFGFSVAVKDEIAVIGAPSTDDGAGRAYVYRRVRGRWHLDEVLEASDRLTGDSYGSGVAVSDRYAIVGAELADGVGTDAGAAYIHIVNPARAARINGRLR